MLRETRNKWKDINNDKIIFSVEYGCCVGPMWQYKPGSVFERDGSGKTQKKMSAPIRDFYEEVILSEWHTWFKKVYKEANDEFYSNTLPEVSNFIHLNFGMLIGKVKSLKKMFKVFNIQPGEDDQHLASDYSVANLNDVIFDYKSDLFYNSAYKHSFRKCINNNNIKEYVTDMRNITNYNILTSFNTDKPLYNNIVPLIKNGNIQFNFNSIDSNNNITSKPAFIQAPGKDWDCYNRILDQLEYYNKYKDRFYKYKDLENVTKF